MNAKFLLSFELNDGSEFFPPVLEKFKRLLPDHFKVIIENNNIYLEIIDVKHKSLSCQQEVERELDRWFFLTTTKVTAEKIEQSCEKAFCFQIIAEQSFPDDIEKQEWDAVLALQLRLWFMANECNELNFKILLLYQVIELSSCIFDKYTNPNVPPSEITECKLLRHLIAHSSLDSNRETGCYLQYLKINKLIDESTFDLLIKSGYFGLANSKLIGILRHKLPIVEKQARVKILEKYFPSMLQK